MRAKNCRSVLTEVFLFPQRFASEKEGDREVQRTMLELLNQLDGFSSSSDIKVLHSNIIVDYVKWCCAGTGDCSDKQG